VRPTTRSDRANPDLAIRSSAGATVLLDVGPPRATKMLAGHPEKGVGGNPSRDPAKRCAARNYEAASIPDRLLGPHAHPLLADPLPCSEPAAAGIARAGHLANTKTDRGAYRSALPVNGTGGTSVAAHKLSRAR
jgi:hypothetical protein